ncbi:OmpA family protein [Sulfitobacter geojensis]|uniref:OmpA family protein n=1 Tax=Sulfitobacter geojensis TaxID=1342299 RepID=UPI0004695339|nr:OmpA family protein [Sulfitobacter geojensis]NYI26742.1 outer membrane protein OmpA-like peptidoglycan-associated protein [Sulfitobacter geojensis]
MPPAPRSRPANRPGTIRAVVGGVALMLLGVGAVTGLRVAVADAPPAVMQTDNTTPSDIALRAMASLIAPPAPDAFSIGDLPQEAPVLLSAGTTSGEDCVQNLDKFLSSAKVPFDENSAEITVDAVAFLEQVSDRIMGCDNAYVVVAGHADGSGDDAVNLALSWERADRALNTLLLLGVDPLAVEAMGFGARAPLSQGSNIDDGADRRVDFKVMRKP